MSVSVFLIDVLKINLFFICFCESLFACYHL